MVTLLGPVKCRRGMSQCPCLILNMLEECWERLQELDISYDHYNP